MPKEVNQAIIGIWITIALSVLAALLSAWSGAISTGEFVWYIIFYSLFCLFPYKLGKGSNPARWVYGILVGISIIFMLGGIGSDMPRADFLVSIIILPIEVFIIFRLFQQKSSFWFAEST